MPEKTSDGSCRGEFSRNDEQQQYLDLDPSEAARLIVALQRVVGDIIASTCVFRGLVLSAFGIPPIYQPFHFSVVDDSYQIDFPFISR